MALPQVSNSLGDEENWESAAGSNPVGSVKPVRGVSDASDPRDARWLQPRPRPGG